MNQESSSQLLLSGNNYRLGIGVEKDEKKAFEYYQKSADMGNAAAINNVGYCYQDGIGVEKDGKKAFEYYQKSADMGNAPAISNVGYCYKNVIGVEKDGKKAFEYYQKSADMGNAPAINNVGYCYQDGIGVEKDGKKAFEYYQKSADMGNAAAINQVGNCYRLGIGVENDEKKAFEYYQKSADMGDATAIKQVGYCYENGIGVEKDGKKAFEYYQKSADMGDADAINQVGNCYRNGIGVARNIRSANKCYKKERSIKKIIKSLYPPDLDNNLKNLLDDERYQLSWISYEEFTNIRRIGKGGFATVYCARWHDEGQSVIISVALKIIDYSEKHNLEFINELKRFCEIGYENPSFLQCYGISRDPDGRYIIALKYAAIGSLRQNLKKVSQLEWKKKLNLLHCIVTDLEAIHSQGMIHRDLHSGNILQDTLDSAYITDLGLSISSNEKMEDEKICGILLYIDPQVLFGQKYSQTADIYSFGIIMWEILYGVTVSYIVGESKNERSLQLLICCKDLRPPVNKEAASCYVDLMKECWSKEHENRPSAEKLCEYFKKWQDDENVLSELNKSKIKLENIEKSYADMISKGSKVHTTTKSILDRGDSGLQYLAINK